MPTMQRPNYSSIDREILIERIRQLEDEAGLNLEFHPRYNFTETEAAMLGLLVTYKGVITRERAYTFLYGMRADTPGERILDVYICRLRSKLGAEGIHIGTSWGRGWYLDDEDRAKVNAMRLQPAAVAESEAA
jgi:DNA-binding response OmpR family regulator